MSETFESSVSRKVESKKRGKLLTFWLVLMLIANIGTALTYLLNILVSIGMFVTIFGLAGPAILYLMLRFKWGLLE